MSCVLIIYVLFHLPYTWTRPYCLNWQWEWLDSWANTGHVYRTWGMFLLSAWENAWSACSLQPVWVWSYKAEAHKIGVRLISSLTLKLSLSLKKDQVDEQQMWPDHLTGLWIYEGTAWCHSVSLWIRFLLKQMLTLAAHHTLVSFVGLNEYLQTPHFHLYRNRA